MKFIIEWETATHERYSTGVALVFDRFEDESTFYLCVGLIFGWVNIGLVW